MQLTTRSVSSSHPLHLFDGANVAKTTDVAFRAAKSIHQQQRPTAFTPRDDDGSASSSSASSTSSSSRFPSTPYTYQSTRASSNQYVPGLGKASAIPTHLSGKSRSTSHDYGSSLAPPNGSLRRISDQDRPSSSYRGPSSLLKQPRQTIPSSHFTTSSFQPPAPFSSRLGGDPSSLRLPPKVSSASSSLAESTARMSIADVGGSGYNQYASSRPDRLEGTTLDAGVHGMKRSWDGFKLEVKFGARRAKKSGESSFFKIRDIKLILGTTVERKVLNL